MICTAAGWIRGCCLVAIEYAAGADGWAHYRPTQCSAGFLGRRASSIYFCMTETTRFGLGCIGMLSGILATTIAVCAGGLLVRLARPPFHYKVKHLVFFYYMASLHFCAAVVLEEPAQS